MEKSVFNGCYYHTPKTLSKGAVLDVGLKCTHSCKFCYYSYLDNSENQFDGMRKAKFRTKEECKEILRLIKENGWQNFDYTGGEATIHPDIIEITRYAHQELGLKGRIITLGQFLMKKMPNCKTHRLVDDLLEAGLTNFLFSFHASDKELYHNITGENLDNLLSAMNYLDSIGFQYTSNSTVFEESYKDLPKLANEILKHNIYMHNFVVMNAYYQWANGKRVTGVQAKYSDIYKYLKEATDILESNNIAVNIRFSPMCVLKELEKNIVGVVGVRYDPYEWMNMAGHMGGEPNICAYPIKIQEGNIETNFKYFTLNEELENNLKIIGMRGSFFKVFTEKCFNCGAKVVCDGIDPKYLEEHKDSEFTPYESQEKLPLHQKRIEYLPAFVVKTEQYTDMKKIISEEFSKYRSLKKENKKPRVSVIVTCYNYANYIEETLNSILKQTYKDFEIIIVNDGSTDYSEEVILKIISENPDYNIRLINKKNQGSAEARNTGCKSAHGEFILILDADDLIEKTMLEESVKILDDNKNISIVYTDRQDFEDSNILVKTTNYNFEKLKYSNQLSYCSLFRKKVFDDIGCFRTNVNGCEDWDFWIAAGGKNHFAFYLPKPLFKYRVNSSGQYQDFVNQQDYKFAQIVKNNSELYPQDAIDLCENLLKKQVIKKESLVSIIIPTFNRPKTLKKSIESVLDQKYKNIEIIVINDGGCDVENIIKELNATNNIKYISLDKNFGRSYARNMGLNIAQGKYIGYLDDDDIFYPEHIKTLVNYMENNNKKAVHSYANLKGTKKISDSNYAILNRFSYLFEAKVNDNIYIANLIPNLCLMHHRDFLENIQFDTSLNSHEDWDFLLQLYKLTEIISIKKITCEFQFEYSEKINNYEYRKDHLKTLDKIYSKNLDKILNLKDFSINIQKSLNLNYKSELIQELKNELFNLVLKYEKEENYENMENILKRLCIYEENNPNYNYYLALILYKHSKFDESIKLLSKALSLGTKPNKNIFELMANNLRELGNIELSQIYQEYANKLA